MTGTILITIFLLQTFYTSCDLIEPKTTLVTECPKNENETIQASKKLKCGVDEFDNNQYLCLPHVNKTSFVEFCFNGSLGIWEKGNCLETDGERIILHNCSNFSSGCPDKDFFDYEFYKYPACQKISTEFHCYRLDPFCSTQSTMVEATYEVEETTTYEVEETTTYEVEETTTYKMKETTIHEENDKKSKNIFGISIVVVLVLVGICVIVIFVAKRKYWDTKESQQPDNSSYEMMPFQVESKYDNIESQYTDEQQLENAGSNILPLPRGNEETEMSVDLDDHTFSSVYRSDAENNKEIRIVLLGKTGVGKSATGNSILGKIMFKSEVSASSITIQCTRNYSYRFGHRIVIVDTPGIFDTSLSNPHTQKEISKCITFTSPGPHAFILVLSIHRFTEEEQNSVEHFVKYFGESLYKYLIVLFTRKDDLDEENKSLNDFITSSPPELKTIIKKCDERVIAFNNKLNGKENEEQANGLLNLILKIIKENKDRYYTNKIYEDAENRLRKREKEFIKQTEEEREKDLIETDENNQKYTTNIALNMILQKAKDDVRNDITDKNQLLEDAKKTFQLEILRLREENNRLTQEKYESKYKSELDKFRNDIDLDNG